MRIHRIVRIEDAKTDTIVGPFLAALGSEIPVLRSSGEVDTRWRISPSISLPIIRQSKTTGEWGMNLSSPAGDKFVPVKQFRDPRIATHLSEKARELLDAVECRLKNFYSPTPSQE